MVTERISKSGKTIFPFVFSTFRKAEKRGNANCKERVKVA